MSVMSNMHAMVGNSEATPTDYNTLSNLPQINGVVLIGNKTSSVLKLADYNVADKCLVSVSLSITDWVIKLTTTTKDGTTSTADIDLPKEVYIKGEVKEEEQQIVLTKKDESEDILDLKPIFDKYVPKTTTIADIDLQDDITARELEDAIKDQITTLTNKTISADDNTISELEVDNFKDGVIKNLIEEDGSDEAIPTEKAVIDYVADKVVADAEFYKFQQDCIVLRLKNKRGEDIKTLQICEVVFVNEIQTLTNKTINCLENTITLATDKEGLVNGGLLAIDADNKLYVRNYAGELVCLNDRYLINDIEIPSELKDGNFITNTSLITELKGEDLEIRVKHPVEIMTYNEYQAITPDEDTLYIIKDYPSEDIQEHREMVNNRWVITYTETTLPLLTFIQGGVVHNKKVYYTKQEVNELLAYKEDLLNGAGETITHDDLEADKILVTDDTGKIKASIYDSELLESIGLVITPQVILSSAADSYLSLIY